MADGASFDISSISDIVSIGFAFDTSGLAKGIRAMEQATHVAEQFEGAITKASASTTKQTATERAQADVLRLLTPELQFQMRMTAQMAKEDAQATREKERLVKQVEAIERRLSPVAAVTQTYTRAQESLNAALKAGVIDQTRYNAVLADSKRVHDQAITNLDRFKGSTGLARHELLNLSYQIQDIGVSLASGQSPFRVLVQQGSQIASIFAANGTGAGGIMRQFGQIAIAGLTKFGPLLAVTATAAAGLGLVLRDVNKDAGDLTKGMKLTEDQLEKVKNKGVTFGDVMTGTFNYLAKIVNDHLGPTFRSIGEWFSKAMDAVTSATVTAIKFVVGGFIGAVDGIKAAWGSLPGAIGEIVVNTANRAISLIEAMLNAIGSRINAFIKLANEAAKLAGVQGQLPLLPTLDLPRLKDQFAGDGAAAADAFSGGFRSGFEKGSKAVDTQLKAWETSVIGAARARILKQAGEADEKAAKAAKTHADALKISEAEFAKAAQAGKALERQYDANVKSAEDFIAKLNEEMLASRSTEVETRRRAAALQAAKAPTDELKAKVWEAEKAWEALYNAMHPMQVERPKALDDAIKAAEKLKTPADEAAEALERMWRTFDHVAYSARDAVDAFKSGDWGAAALNVVNAMKAIQKAWNEGDKAGAIASSAQLAGTLIGGTGGKVLAGVGSGIASGAAIGSNIIPGIGTGIGAVVGGIVGLIGGIFGSSAAKKKAEQERQQQEQERLEKIAQQARDIEINLLKLTGQYLKAAAAAREDELKKIDASNVARWQELQNAQLRADFLSRFGTAEEQLADMRAKLAPELESLGLTIDLTRDQFKQLVNEGGTLGASLLDLMEPFDAYTQAVQAQQDALSQAAQDAADALAELGAANAELGAANVATAAAGATAVLEAGLGIDFYGHKTRAAAFKTDSAAMKAASDAAIQAYTDLQASTAALVPDLLKAGDAMGALAAQTKLWFANPSNDRHDMYTGNGGINIGGLNVLMSRVQAEAAKNLIPQIGINTPNARDMLQQLVNVYMAQFNPELGRFGSGSAVAGRFNAVGPAPGLYGALAGLDFVSQRNDASGTFGKDIEAFNRDRAYFQQQIDYARSEITRLAGVLDPASDKFVELNKTIEELNGKIADLDEEFRGLDLDAQIRRIVDFQRLVAQEAQAQVRSVFAQINADVTAFAAAAQAANAPIAQLTDSVAKLKNISDLLSDGLAYADMLDPTKAFANSGLGQNAALVQQAAALAASILTTEDAKRAADALAQTSAFANLAPAQIRDIGLMFDGLSAFDASAFTITFERLSDALNRGAISQGQYSQAVNYALDVFEGLTDASGQVRDAFLDLKTALKLDEQLSPLTQAQKLDEARRQYDANKSESTLRTLLGLEQAVSTSPSDYAYAFGLGLSQLPTQSSPRLQVDNTDLIEQLQSVKDQVAAMKSSNDQLLIQIGRNTKTTADALVDAQSGELPFTTSAA